MNSNEPLLTRDAKRSIRKYMLTLVALPGLVVSILSFILGFMVKDHAIQQVVADATKDAMRSAQQHLMALSAESGEIKSKLTQVRDDAELSRDRLGLIEHEMSEALRDARLQKLMRNASRDREAIADLLKKDPEFLSVIKGVSAEEIRAILDERIEVHLKSKLPLNHQHTELESRLLEEIELAASASTATITTEDDQFPDICVYFSRIMIERAKHDVEVVALMTMLDASGGVEYDVAFLGHTEVGESLSYGPRCWISGGETIRFKLALFDEDHSGRSADQLRAVMDNKLGELHARGGRADLIFMQSMHEAASAHMVESARRIGRQATVLFDYSFDGKDASELPSTLPVFSANGVRVAISGAEAHFVSR